MTKPIIVVSCKPNAKPAQIDRMIAHMVGVLQSEDLEERMWQKWIRTLSASDAYTYN
jgi:hypothetical protein